jgi:hypothetical protein
MGNSAGYFDGWIDELRVSKGVSRWSSDFTPPESAYAPRNNNGEAGIFFE